MLLWQSVFPAHCCVEAFRQRTTFVGNPLDQVRSFALTTLPEFLHHAPARFHPLLNGKRYLTLGDSAIPGAIQIDLDDIIPCFFGPVFKIIIFIILFDIDEYIHFMFDLL
jgi:hypothetical protein